MIDKDGIDLVNRDIDGVTTPEEHARLMVLLQAHEDLRKLHSDLSGLNAGLSGLVREKAPVTLKHSVMRELERAVHAPRHVSPLQRMLAGLQTWSNVQKGITLAGGMVAAVLMVAIGVALFQARPFNENDLAGTLSALGSGGDFSNVTTFDIAGRTTRGTITASYGRDLCVLRLTLTSPGTSQAEVSFDAGSIELKAVRPSSSLASRLDIQSGKIAVSGATVENLVAVFASRSSSQPYVRVKVTDSDGTVSERVISVVAPNKN
jgi:hypothetical protein